jgi:hypothetical protein
LLISSLKTLLYAIFLNGIKFESDNGNIFDN